MAEKLGEMLLQVGALTEAQLEQVLSAQSIYGGRLGTNLVEMGLVTEEELALLLNEKLGVPAVDAAALENIPRPVAALIPQEMAQRFKVVPVAVDGKRLTLAMADPADFAAIDEIGFFTGLVIIPRVCSELRLSLALERYYGIKRALHFIPVPGGVRTRIINMTRENAGLAPDQATGTLTSRLQHNPEFGQSKGGRQLAAAAAAKLRSRSMDAVASSLAAAAGEGEVVTTLMNYLKGDFDRAGFLRLKQDAAVGVQAFSDGEPIPAFAGSRLEIGNASLLKKVLKEQEPFLGTLPVDGAEVRILARIGGAPGAPVLLMPIVIGGVSIAFLLVEDEKGRLAPGLFDLQRVIVKAQLAFEMLGIRKRIALA